MDLSFESGKSRAPPLATAKGESLQEEWEEALEEQEEWEALDL